MFIRRDKKEDCIIAGMVISDAKEKEYNGKKFIEFGVGIGKDEEGNNLPIVNIAIWEREIEIQKGDRVLACGKLKITQKEDKTYYSMHADFVSKENTTKAQKQEEKKVLLEPVEDDDIPF